MKDQRYHGLALNLFCAFIAYRHGITMQTAKKNYADDDLGEYWYWLAEQVEGQMTGAMDAYMNRVSASSSKVPQ